MRDPVPSIPVSWGELIDKITILEIKVARLTVDEQRANAAKELDMLREIARPVLSQPDIAHALAELKTINADLWEIEDEIRQHERMGKFDSEFIALARSVYRRNDERGRIKRGISLALGSGLIEEKSYKPY
jgi:hypothetical protein